MALRRGAFAADLLRSIRAPRGLKAPAVAAESDRARRECAGANLRLVYFARLPGFARAAAFAGGLGFEGGAALAVGAGFAGTPDLAG